MIKITENLYVSPAYNKGDYVIVTINDYVYKYYPSENLTVDELAYKFNIIRKYSHGKALAWLKKNISRYERISSPKDKEKSTTINEKYVVFAEGTWYNYRALFYKRNSKAMYCYESQADIFSRDEADRITRFKGKYKWIKKRINNR